MRFRKLKAAKVNKDREARRQDSTQHNSDNKEFPSYLCQEVTFLPFVCQYRITYEQISLKHLRALA